MGLLKIAALQRGTPLLSEDVYSAIVMMVVVTTLITPIALRWAFHD
jgi:hypothetical protein